LTTPSRRPKHLEAKILIPIGLVFNKRRITQALHALSAFRKPTVVLLHIVEVPSRTATLEPEPYQDDIEKAKRTLTDLVVWLRQQGFRARLKVALARSAAQGILDELEIDGYFMVFLMKRKTPRGLRRLFTHSVSQEVVKKAHCLILTSPLEE